MRYAFSLILLIAVLATGCPSPDQSPGKGGLDSAACKVLDQLMAELEVVDSVLLVARDWAGARKHLDQVMDLMEQNVRRGEERCHYLNQKNYPEHPRFLFVDGLSQNIVSDTLPDGIYYLVRLRGIFSDDAAISEYLSEELAQIALHNPQAYLGYLQMHPDQEVMLLYSTKWNFLDADELIRRFGELPDSGAVVDYLKEWKAKYAAGER